MAGIVDFPYRAEAVINASVTCAWLLSIIAACDFEHARQIAVEG